MRDVESLSHTKWDCKYHIVWIPKYRRKALYTGIRPELGSMLRTLAEQKESKILEGHLRPDHVHIGVSIPPKLSISSVVGYIKGKSAIFIARNLVGRRRNFVPGMSSMAILKAFRAEPSPVRGEAWRASQTVAAGQYASAQKTLDAASIFRQRLGELCRIFF